MENPKLPTDDQLAEIRAGVKEGIRGPVMLKWVRLAARRAVTHDGNAGVI